jgi:hypothetical protein
MQERSKGQAGMGGRGKNQARTRLDKATRRKVRVPKIAKGIVPCEPAGKNPRKRNQKRNQRIWHGERASRVKKANRVSQEL